MVVILQMLLAHQVAPHVHWARTLLLVELRQAKDVTHVALAPIHQRLHPRFVHSVELGHTTTRLEQQVPLIAFRAHLVSFQVHQGRLNAIRANLVIFQIRLVRLLASHAQLGPIQGISMPHSVKHARQVVILMLLHKHPITHANCVVLEHFQQRLAQYHQHRANHVKQVSFRMQLGLLFHLDALRVVLGFMLLHRNPQLVLLVH